MLGNIAPIKHKINTQTAWLCNQCLAFPKTSEIKIMRNSDLFPQNDSLTAQVKLEDLKRQQKLGNFGDSRSKVDSKIVSSAYRNIFRRCKDWEIVQVVS